jgi:hypothetical protein
MRDQAVLINSGLSGLKILKFICTALRSVDGKRTNTASVRSANQRDSENQADPDGLERPSVLLHRKSWSIQFSMTISTCQSRTAQVDRIRSEGCCECERRKARSSWWWTCQSLSLSSLNRGQVEFAGLDSATQLCQLGRHRGSSKAPPNLFFWKQGLIGQIE